MFGRHENIPPLLSDDCHTGFCCNGRKKQTRFLGSKYHTHAFADPSGAAYSAPPDTLAGLGEWGEGGTEGERKGRERGWNRSIPVLLFPHFEPCIETTVLCNAQQTLHLLSSLARWHHQSLRHFVAH